MTSPSEDDRIRVYGDIEAAADTFEQLPVMIVVTDGPEQRTVAFNAAVRAALQNRYVYGEPIFEGFAMELGGQGFADAFGVPAATGQTVTLNEHRIQLHQPDGTVDELFLDLVCSPRLDAEGRPRGTILFATDVTQRVRDKRVAQREVEELRERYAEARGSVRAMQRALLPDSVPVSPSFDVAARYVLAADEDVAGGDWFDAVARDDGSLVLVVGDVVGHGSSAAVAMGQLRSVLLSQLRAGAGIRDALVFLDVFAASVQNAARATVCVAEIDADGNMEYCTAGHPTPLIASTDGIHDRYLPPSGATPLVTGSDFPVARAHVGVGESVVLYSDGIVERPGVTPTTASMELLTTVSNAHQNLLMPAGAPTSAAERIASLSIELLTRRTGHTDDITLLAAERHPARAALELELTATPAAPLLARAALRSWLESLDARRADIDKLLHASTELVTNVVDHAHLDGEEAAFLFSARLGGDGTVTLEVSDRGTWKLPIVTENRGRGLALVRALVDELAIDHSDDGTTATIRHALTRPSGLLEGVASATKHDPEFFDVFSEGGPEPVITVVGPLDASTTPAVEPHLNLSLTDAGTTLTIDLTEVTLLASAGVNLLFRTLEQAKALELHIHLVAPNGSPAQHVLSLVGLPRHHATPSTESH